MATVPVLRLPDFERQFIVTTDASDVAIGEILEQDFGSGLQPIAFSSRKLNATKIRYSAYETELLRIMWTIGQWKHYFQGAHPHSYPNGPCSVTTPTQSNIRQKPSLALAGGIARI